MINRAQLYFFLIKNIYIILTGIYFFFFYGCLGICIDKNLISYQLNGTNKDMKKEKERGKNIYL